MNVRDDVLRTSRLYGGTKIPGGTLNVEVVGMVCSSDIFLENLKIYPDFDFKPLIIPKLQFLGPFLGLFWEKLL